MKNKYIVNVTQNDIDNGRARDCEHCPLALALSRATGKNIGVGKRYIQYILGLKNPLIARMDDTLLNFIEVFDTGGDVKPFDFEIELDWDGIQP